MHERRIVLGQLTLQRLDQQRLARPRRTGQQGPATPTFDCVPQFEQGALMDFARIIKPRIATAIERFGRQLPIVFVHRGHLRRSVRRL